METALALATAALSDWVGIQKFSLLSILVDLESMNITENGETLRTSKQKAKYEHGII